MKTVENIHNELSKGEKTRIRIIEAATELIFEQGFYRVTFAQIAKMAGLTQPAIYSHFKNMDDLLIQSALYWSKEAKGFVDEGISGLRSAEEELRSVVERNLLYPLKNRKKDALFIGLYYYAIGSKEAMQAYNEIKERGIHRLHALIARGNREGCWNVKNPLDSAYSLHSLFVGEIFKVIIQPKEEATEDRIRRVLKTIMAVLKN